MALKADALLRLYPRRWRERYGDEMRALLADTTLTPAVIVDLIVGALREWVREIARQPGPPVDLKHEWRRALRRAVTFTLGMGGVTWTVAQALLWAGVRAESDYLWLIVLGPLVIIFWAMRGEWRRSRLQYRNIIGFEKVPPEKLRDPGISVRLYRMGVLLTAVTLIVYWMLLPTSWRSPTFPPLMQDVIDLYPVWAIASLPRALRARTRTELLRREQINQLALAEQQARQTGSWS